VASAHDGRLQPGITQLVLVPDNGLSIASPLMLPVECFVLTDVTDHVFWPMLPHFMTATLCFWTTTTCSMVHHTHIS